jgi:TDG/mug DNA glycosylase family protein
MTNTTETPDEVGDSTLLTFGASLERFKHDNAEKEAITTSNSSRHHVTRSSRKRPLDDAYDAQPASKKPASPSPTKRTRVSSRYAPPSKYAHLTPLTDILVPGLICIFVGTNPGVTTATTGHAYAHPSNQFWKLLHSSGCTDRRLQPSQDVDLPRLYSMGNTNIVSRPSKDAGELSKAEMAAGTPVLEEKVAKFRPEAVCIVGKGIWEAVWRWRYKREMRKEEFRYGWQEDGERMGKVTGEEWEGARVFVTTSTSGLSASTKPAEKEAIWRPFGQWVKQRREERRLEAETGNAVKEEAT